MIYRQFRKCNQANIYKNIPSVNYSDYRSIYDLLDFSRKEFWNN